MKTGVDIVEIKRIENIVERKKEFFYKKIFTYREIEYIRDKGDNVKTIAGMFAAKEAVSKVLGTGIGLVNWKDIEILHDSEGRPHININDKLQNILKDHGLKEIEISISHERQYAISFAIGF